jgi:hypothetical protein
VNQNGIIQMDDAIAFAGSVDAFMHQWFSRGDAVKTWMPRQVRA